MHIFDVRGPLPSRDTETRRRSGFAGPALLFALLGLLSTPMGAASALAEGSFPDGVTIETYGDQAILMKDGQPGLPPVEGGPVPRGTADPNQIEMAIVADAAFVARYGDEAEARICGLVAATRQLFQRSSTVDFELHHTATILNAGADPYGVTPATDGSVDPTELLSAFRNWAGAGVSAPNDVVALASGYDFTGSVVGFAFTGAACTSASALIVQDFGVTSFDASTLAHELGHNLGMCHDPPASRNGPSCSALSSIPDPEATCGGFVMAASSSLDSPASEFSECSAADHENWLAGASSACLTDTPGTTVDCTGLACPELPLSDCARAASTSLKVARGKTTKANQIKWNWKKGDDVALAGLGDPSDTTDYMLCMYDGSGGAPLGVSRLRVPARPAWASKGEKGWQYKDKEGAFDGVSKISLRPGPAGRSGISLLAKGAGTPLPPALNADSWFELLPELTVQLQSSEGDCWEATYTAADAKKNEATKFLAKTK